MFNEQLTQLPPSSSAEVLTEVLDEGEEEGDRKSLLDPLHRHKILLCYVYTHTRYIVTFNNGLKYNCQSFLYGLLDKRRRRSPVSTDIRGFRKNGGVIKAYLLTGIKSNGSRQGCSWSLH